MTPKVELAVSYDQLLAGDLVKASELLASGTKLDYLHALAAVCGAGSNRYQLARDKYWIARAHLETNIKMKSMDPVYVLLAAAQLLDPYVKLPDPEPQVVSPN